MTLRTERARWSFAGLSNGPKMWLMRLARAHRSGRTAADNALSHRGPQARLRARRAVRRVAGRPLAPLRRATLVTRPRSPPHRAPDPIGVTSASGLWRLTMARRPRWETSGAEAQAGMSGRQTDRWSSGETFAVPTKEIVFCLSRISICL